MPFARVSYGLDLRIVKLKGYVFFSSCVSIVQSIEHKFNKEDKYNVARPKSSRNLLETLQNGPTSPGI